MRTHVKRNLGLEWPSITMRQRFVTRSISGFRQNIEFLPLKDQLSALTAQYQLSQLKSVGFDPVLPSMDLDDYLNDFAAMHLDYTARLSRETQQRIMKKVLQRVKGSKLDNVLEIHQIFWNQEKHVAHCISLLNEVLGCPVVGAFHERTFWSLPCLQGRRRCQALGAQHQYLAPEMVNSRNKMQVFILTCGAMQFFKDMVIGIGAWDWLICSWH